MIDEYYAGNVYQWSSQDHKRPVIDLLEGLPGLETYYADYGRRLWSLTCMLHPFQMVLPNLLQYITPKSMGIFWFLIYSAFTTLAIVAIVYLLPV